MPCKIDLGKSVFLANLQGYFGVPAKKIILSGLNTNILPEILSPIHGVQCGVWGISISNIIFNIRSGCHCWQCLCIIQLCIKMPMPHPIPKKSVWLGYR